MLHEYISNDTDCSGAETIALVSELDFFSNIFPEVKTKHPENPFISSEFISENSALAFRNIVNSKNDIEILGWALVALSDIINNLNLISTEASGDLELAPRLTAYIYENFQKPLTIKYLSKEFGYSSSYIAHVFCDQLKVPFRTYLTAIRSEHAAHLILSTSKSLTEISYECGYNSLNTFCRCFKKHFLKTPREYRKSLKTQTAVSD